MRKEWALVVVSTLLTLVLALMLIRWLAPQIFGVPLDLQLVSVDESRVPFFDLVFDQEGIAGASYSVADPHAVQRGAALIASADGYGPHDLVGFRNMAVPNVADVVVIGDSQTYGAGVTLAESWPHRLRSHLADAGKDAVVYSMALGGWAPPQYHYVLKHALRLRPRVIVVAFYSGNDPLETFTQVYGSPRWERLRREGNFRTDDFPQLVFPAPREDQWRVDLPGERWLHFTAKSRRLNVMDHPMPDEGWRLMQVLAAEMAELASAADTQILFTIIPTREYAYAPFLRELNIEQPPDFSGLVAEEKAHLDAFSARLNTYPNSRYVSSIEALQDVVRQIEWAYPNGVDGHPLPAGHNAIAKALADAVARHVPDLACGRFRVDGEGRGMLYGFANEQRDYWLAGGAMPPEWAEAPILSRRDLSRLQLRSPANLRAIAGRIPDCTPSARQPLSGN